MSREDHAHVPLGAAFVGLVALAMVTTMMPGTIALADSDEDPLTEVPEGASTVEGCAFVEEWYDQLLAKHEPGTAVPLKYEPTDEDLAELGLPPAEELKQMDFEEPTMFMEDGSTKTVSKELLKPGGPRQAAPSEEVPVHHSDDHEKGGGNNDDGSTDDGNGTLSDSPALATYAGTGCLGIRPGGWYFNLDGTFTWCTLAHVYDTQISTAGHCAGNGDVLTMIGLVGDNDLAPVLLDFGEVATSKANGIGDDYALVDVYDKHQDLMTPEMCVWGGPYLGTYQNEGVLVSGSWGGQGPSVDVNPDPTLVEGIVHYGHGVGIGTGGTPRAGAGASWGSDYFIFVGAIAPGDSGSGANTATTEAAGIITHIIVDPVMRDGVGIAAGTRATVIGSATTGLPIGIPAPLPS